MRIKDTGILIVGAGEQASGIAHRLYTVGFQVIMTEIEKPLSVRRHVCFSSAVILGSQVVEGIIGTLFSDHTKAVSSLVEHHNIPVIVDPELKILTVWKPILVVDATLRKSIESSNDAFEIVTNVYKIPLVGLGPCWEAGLNCKCVIETLRGPSLGRVLWAGKALQDTGVPEAVCGITEQRVLRAPASGILKHIDGIDIGTCVERGDIVAVIDCGNSTQYVKSSISGIVRGLLGDGVFIKRNVKVGDVDPRLTASDLCVLISDKARALGGSVLEAALVIMQKDAV